MVYALGQYMSSYTYFPAFSSLLALEYYIFSMVTVKHWEIKKNNQPNKTKPTHFVSSPVSEKVDFGLQIPGLEGRSLSEALITL